MGRKKLSVAVFMSTAVLGGFASSASASIATEAAKFYEGSSALSSIVTADYQIANHTGTGEKFTLKGHVGSPTSVSIHLTATEVHCGLNCSAENKVTSTKEGTTIGVMMGKLSFTGVSAMEPAGCSVSSETGEVGTITTKTVSIHVDFMHEGKAFISIFPTEGSTLAQLRVSGGGCTAVEGPYNITGTLYGEGKRKTGETSTSQEFEVSPSIQTTTGAELKLGGNKAELTGTFGAFLLNGLGIEQSFSIKP